MTGLLNIYIDLKNDYLFQQNHFLRFREVIRFEAVEVNPAGGFIRIP